MKHNFAPARPEEPTVFGACRPGCSDGQVGRWLSFMREKGIRRVLCLLSPSQASGYETPLLESYRRFVGREHALWNPVQDFSLVSREDLKTAIMPFLRESDSLKMPVVVHCYAGMGRTGIVLASWLCQARNLSPSDALQTVTENGRIPLEVVEAGRASMEELLALVGGK